MRAWLGTNHDQIDFYLSVRTLSAVLDLILFTENVSVQHVGYQHVG